MPRDLDFKREKRVRSRVHSFDMVRSQLPGLAAQVARGQVKNVVILDGANDFLLPLKAGEAGTLEPAAYAAALPGITAQAGANLTTAVTTLLASSPHVRLVISTIDISNLPIVRSLTALSPAFGSYNGVIRGLASSSPRVAAPTRSQIGFVLSPGGMLPAPHDGFRLSGGGWFKHVVDPAQGSHPGRPTERRDRQERDLSQFSGHEAELQAAVDVRVNLALPSRTDGEGQLYQSDGPGVERSGLLGRLTEAAVGVPHVGMFSDDRLNNWGQGFAGHRFVSRGTHLASCLGRLASGLGRHQGRLKRGGSGKEDVVFLVDMEMEVGLQARQTVVQRREGRAAVGGCLVIAGQLPDPL